MASTTNSIHCCNQLAETSCENSTSESSWSAKHPKLVAAFEFANPFDAKRFRAVQLELGVEGMNNKST
jgi:hypothetical protein